MAFEKVSSDRLGIIGIKRALFFSLVFHGLLFAFLVYRFPKSEIRPAGLRGGLGPVRVSLVDGESTSTPPHSVSPPLSREGLTPPPQESDPLPGSSGEEGEARGGEGETGKKGEGGDGGEMGHSEILQRIRMKIERAKYYPLIAKRSNMEGSPRVEFKIRDDGSLESILLISSSGYSLLDSAALDTVRKAAPFPFYSDPISLNITYSLGLQ